MVLRLQMPRMGYQMREGTIKKVLAPPGVHLERGVPLLEVRVDLSAVAEQNCNPAFIFRMVAAEAGWLRQVDVGVGDCRQVGATLAMVTTHPDEVIAEAAMRPFRVSLGTVLHVE